MFKYIYGTTRSLNLDSSLDLNKISLNGGYTTSFFNVGQFKDFQEANITKLSMPIPNDRFIGKIPVIDEDENPTGEYVPKLTRFIMLRYSDKFTTQEDLIKSIERTSANTDVQMFETAEKAILWISENTDLVQENVGEFIIREAYVDENGDSIETEYLIID